MQTDSKYTFTLLILSLNEVEGMKKVLPRIDKNWVDEIIVMDGNSTDGSIEYARGQGFNVVIQKEKGVIPAIQEGIAMSKSNYIIFFSPDNNCIPEHLPTLVSKVKEGYDMVTVSRYKGDAFSEDDNLITSFGNWMFSKLSSVLFRNEITDLLGIYRCFRKNILEELNIVPNGAINTQLTLRCHKAKYKLGEIPGNEPPRIGGETKRSIIVHGIVELYTILRERFVS